MKKRFLKLRISALICVLIMFFGFTAFAQSIEDIKVLRISPQDERAIVRTPDGMMRIIKVGDVIKSYQRSAISDQGNSFQRSAFCIEGD